MERLETSLKECVDACNETITACKVCINETLGMEEMKRCHQLCLDCIDVCTTCARLCAAKSDYAEELARLCAKICRDCAEECNKHDMDVCQECANICRDCAEKCDGITVAA